MLMYTPLTAHYTHAFFKGWREQLQSLKMAPHPCIWWPFEDGKVSPEHESNPNRVGERTVGPRGHLIPGKRHHNNCIWDYYIQEGRNFDVCALSVFPFSIFFLLFSSFFLSFFLLPSFASPLLSLGLPLARTIWPLK